MRLSTLDGELPSPYIMYTHTHTLASIRSQHVSNVCMCVLCVCDYNLHGSGRALRAARALCVVYTRARVFVSVCTYGEREPRAQIHKSKNLCLWSRSSSTRTHAHKRTDAHNRHRQFAVSSHNTTCITYDPRTYTHTAKTAAHIHYTHKL